MKQALVVMSTAIVVLLVSVSCSDRNEPGHPAGYTANPGGKQIIPAKDAPRNNNACLACHNDFAKEPISRKHARENVYCVNCHGRSNGHMDTTDGSVPPDQVFDRSEVAAFCGQCHKPEHHPQKDKAAFLRKWEGQEGPSGRLITSSATCTDCHGRHMMHPQVKPGLNRIALFNGKDLTGWVAEGGARWSVENGMMVGIQGPNNEAGDLFTEAVYDDFDLEVEYRIDWPANSGVWFRYQSPKIAYQADILEFVKPECYSGTFYCPGKMFLAMNTDKTLVNREGWNMIRVRAEGKHVQIWLNGRQVADVEDDTTSTGRIGFQIHPGDQFGKMKLTVRKITLENLKQR